MTIRKAIALTIWLALIYANCQTWGINGWPQDIAEWAMVKRWLVLNGLFATIGLYCWLSDDDDTDRSSPA